MVKSNTTDTLGKFVHCEQRGWPRVTQGMKRRKKYCTAFFYWAQRFFFFNFFLRCAQVECDLFDKLQFYTQYLNRESFRAHENLLLKGHVREFPTEMIKEWSSKALKKFSVFKQNVLFIYSTLATRLQTMDTRINSKLQKQWQITFLSARQMNSQLDWLTVAPTFTTTISLTWVWIIHDGNLIVVKQTSWIIAVIVVSLKSI